MDCRILVRFIGVQEDLDALWNQFMEHFPEAELPSIDSGEWYSVEEYMTDEYECRFEELPQSELYAIDGTFIVENEPPEDILTEILERFERVYAVFKWSTMLVAARARAGASSMPTVLMTALTKRMKSPKPFWDSKNA